MTREGSARGGVMALAAALALAAAPAAAQGPPPCPGSDAVRPGDTLVRVAERCGISVPALLAANPGVGHNQDLVVGSSVRIPPPGTPEPSPEEACGGFYTIRPGDTLGGVALKCGLTVPLLVAANPGLPATPLALSTGQRLRIPPLPRAAVANAVIAAPTAAVEVAADAPARIADPELVRLEGTLEQGRRCRLVRGDDGTVTGVVGRMGSAFRPGDRVSVLGLATDAARCGVPSAIELRIIWKDRP